MVKLLLNGFDEEINMDNTELANIAAIIETRKEDLTPVIRMKMGSLIYMN
jgi:hypothetical protein